MARSMLPTINQDTTELKVAVSLDADAQRSFRWFITVLLPVDSATELKIDFKLGSVIDQASWDRLDMTFARLPQLSKITLPGSNIGGLQNLVKLDLQDFTTRIYPTHLARFVKRNPDLETLVMETSSHYQELFEDVGLPRAISNLPKLRKLLVRFGDLDQFLWTLNQLTTSCPLIGSYGQRLNELAWNLGVEVEGCDKEFLMLMKNYAKGIARWKNLRVLKFGVPATFLNNDWLEDAVNILFEYLHD
ncbi:hypothetical protein EK21DRAFT_113863 [Setomelanomma holmii]|uniref:Uncharacterized protein n=1 Tax=Setomelanomma holmii TaxID=210430 RepID=A0A9P4H5F6_9PLEO|nr:hypothetical protein EK21DRAFT_113863 [Setomelanomma holmii]